MILGLLPSCLDSEEHEESIDVESLERPIVGGSLATEVYPFMVMMLKQVGGGWYKAGCGASLIDKDWVVSAAHCARAFGTGTTLGILVGKNNPWDGSMAGEIIQISKTIQHPNYAWSSDHNDIALFKLAQSSSFSPIELTTQDPQVGYYATATGWGATFEGGSSSDNLLEVDVPIVSNDKCDKAYGNIEITQICAGFEQGGKDACQGDSGGPLFVESNGSYKLIGITSWGRGCARPGKYGVYTRVSKYIDWIESNTGIDMTDPDPDPDPAPDPAPDPDPEPESTGKGYMVSKHSNFSTNDTNFTTSETLYLKVWDSAINYNDIKKSEYEIKIGGYKNKSSLANHGNGTFSTTITLNKLPQGTGTLKVKLEDKKKNKYQISISINIH